MSAVARRDFLKRAGAVGGGALMMTPLTNFATRAALGDLKKGQGYGPLVSQGDGELALPQGFQYSVVSRQGDVMSDGNPTPGLFDGMATFKGDRDTTILIRNHENRRRSGETLVVVPPDLRYDSDPSYNAGNTKLVIDNQTRTVIESFGILGGTSTNCAGGQMPWGSWIASEEVHDDGDQPHGYNFEIDAYSAGPVDAVPITGAGRFVHEAVVWLHGALYESEDRTGNAALYRYVPDKNPRRPGDLAASTGVLETLVIKDMPNAMTDVGWPVGQPFECEWAAIDEPEPATDTLRDEAHTKGAANFDRQEGMWVSHSSVYFDCTSGGAAGEGQIWQYDVHKEELTLIYESPGADVLKQPDNLVVTPNEHLLLCEDADAPQFIRGLSRDGSIYDFAEALVHDSEFAGACFDSKGDTLYVNQQGSTTGSVPGVTYAIWGPWKDGK